MTTVSDARLLCWCAYINPVMCLYKTPHGRWSQQVRLPALPLPLAGSMGELCAQPSTLTTSGGPAVPTSGIWISAWRSFRKLKALTSQRNTLELGNVNNSHPEAPTSNPREPTGKILVSGRNTKAWVPHQLPQRPTGCPLWSMTY